MTFKTPGKIVPVALKSCGVPTLPMDAYDQHLFKKHHFRELNMLCSEQLHFSPSSLIGFLFSNLYRSLLWRRHLVLGRSQAFRRWKQRYIKGRAAFEEK